jgi:hypothetical protein
MVTLPHMGNIGWLSQPEGQVGDASNIGLDLLALRSSTMSSSVSRVTKAKTKTATGRNIYSCWTGLPACESRGRSVALRLLPIGYDAVLADAVKFSRSIFSGAKFPDAA